MKNLTTFIFFIFLTQNIFAIDLYPGKRDTTTSRVFSAAIGYNSYDLNLRDFPNFLEYKTLEVYTIYSWFTYKHYLQFELLAKSDAPLVDTTFYIDIEFSIGGANKRLDTLEINVDIRSPEIIANFRSDILEGPNPLTVSYINNTTGKYTDLLWSFGDGKTSSEENPVHMYNSTGIFDTQLIASNETSSDTFLQENYIKVYELPTGKVTGGGGICPNDSTEITFTFTGSPPWNFKWSDGVNQNSETTSDSIFNIQAKTEGDFFLVSLKDSNDTTITNFTETISVWFNPIPEKPAISFENSLSFCDSESILLNAPSGFNTYNWTNGSSSEMVEIFQSTLIAVSLSNEFGCYSGFSDTLEIEVFDLPIKPVIIQNVDTLEILEADSIQWYLNGEIMDGANLNQLEIEKSGNYYVEVFNQNGCKNKSEELFLVYSESNLITTIKDDFTIYPNPFNQLINIDFLGNKSDLISWELFQLDGKIIKSKNLWQQENIILQINTSDVKPGMYFIHINSLNMELSQKVIKL